MRRRFLLEREQDVADVLNSGGQSDTVLEVARAVDVEQPAKKSKWYRWRKDGTALVSYLLDSEVHTFAFSVAANAILSFIPFTVLLYTLSNSVFHSDAMKDVVNDMVNYFLPSVASKDWMTHNLYLRPRPGRAVLLAADDSGRLHGHLSSAGGGAESGLGRDQEPQLSSKPSDRLWPGDHHGGAGHEQHSAEHSRARGAEVLLPSSDKYQVHRCCS